MTKKRALAGLLCAILIFPLMGCALLSVQAASDISTDELWANGKFYELAAQCDKVKTGHCPVYLAEWALMQNRNREALRTLEAITVPPGFEKRTAMIRAEASYRLRDFSAASRYFRVAGNEAVATKLSSFAREPYQVEASNGRTEIKFLQTDPLPIVSLTVDGKQGYFIVDTGGAELIIDPDFATSLNLPDFGSTNGMFGGGTRAPVRHSRISKLDLGEFALREVPVTLLSTAKFSSVGGGRPIAGVLGTSIFYWFTTTIDYPRGMLTLQLSYDPVRDQPSGATVLPMLMAGDHFILSPGQIGDAAEGLMFIDTGLAGPMFAAPDSTLIEAGIAIGEKSYEGGSGGGPIRVIPVEAKSVRLGPIKQLYATGLAGIFPPALEHRFGYRIAGLLSHGFLRDYAVTFDFERMVLVLSQ